jgi:hypothetical protein
MSVVHVGATAFNYAELGSRLVFFSQSSCNTTRATNMSVFIADSSMLLTKAFSSKCHPIQIVSAFTCNGLFLFGLQNRFIQVLAST